MKQTVCRCGLFRFPHRKSDRCDDYADEQRDMADERRKIDAEELYCFNSAEADAINAERRRA